MADAEPPSKRPHIDAQNTDDNNDYDNFNDNGDHYYMPISNFDNFDDVDVTADNEGDAAAADSSDDSSIDSESDAADASQAPIAAAATCHDAADVNNSVHRGENNINIAATLAIAELIFARKVTIFCGIVALVNENIVFLSR